MPTTLTLDTKLTPKGKRLLEVLSDTQYSRLSNKEKAEKAGVSECYYYDIIKTPGFVNAVRLRGLSECITYTVPMVKRMAQDGLNGKYMQQKTMLEIAGLVQQNPLVNVILNNNVSPSEDIDKQILSKIIEVAPTL